MSTWIEVAREIFPDASDEDLDWIIWGRTGFPIFWRLQEGEDVEACFRRQLTEYRDAAAALEPGKRLCDLCNHVAVDGQWKCEECAAALEEARKEPA